MPLAAVVVVVIVAAALGVFGGQYIAHICGNTTNPFRLLQRSDIAGKPVVRILMMGEDNTGSKKSKIHGLSDTLVVLAIKNGETTREIRAISIPRDTMVEIPGHKTCKINAANKFGGPELSKQVIETLLATNIDYYIDTSTSGLRGLVDLVGGVNVVVDENMNYDDDAQDLHIHLKASPEKQLLKGHDAEGFVRFRHDKWGDSGWKIVDGKKVAAGRIARQQIFMRALANRILSMPTKRQRAEVLNTAVEKGYLVSNMQLNDWGALADLMKDVNPDKIQMAVLPGAPGNIHHASYWIPDTQKIPQVVAQQMLFQGVSTEGMTASVEVLNGCGVPGAAGKVAEVLQRAGFTVTKQGNAPGFAYDRCQLITRQGNTAGVLEIKKMLKCDDVKEEKKTKGLPDITVIVGKDYCESNT